MGNSVYFGTEKSDAEAFLKFLGSNVMIVNTLFYSVPIRKKLEPVMVDAENDIEIDFEKVDIKFWKYPDGRPPRSNVYLFPDGSKCKYFLPYGIDMDGSVIEILPLKSDCWTFYVAGKTKYAKFWRFLRDSLGAKIVSRWIDKNDVFEREECKRVAVDCLRDVAQADIFILYVEKDDNLKYSLVELGAALALDKKCYIINNEDNKQISRTMFAHPNIIFIESVAEALDKNGW